jgi:hypothetical protein
VFLAISYLVGLLVCLGIDFGNNIHHAQINTNSKHFTEGKVNTNTKYFPAGKINTNLNHCPKVKINTNLKCHPAGTS